MTPHYTDPWLTVYAGDCRDVLPTLAADSVDCVVTSPPYWGLRDYGTATWLGGDKGCDHSGDGPVVGNNMNVRGKDETTMLVGGWDKAATDGHQRRTVAAGGSCAKCGATRQDAQLGLEATPEEYVANLVAVFREVRRVLKPSGTCWLNLGDSYASGGGIGGAGDGIASDGYARRNRQERGRSPLAGLKPKDLVGIPWRVAFALQADGWYLRSDIIWSKPNPMPESVTDRPTKSHEYLFLLTRSPRYYFDADAVREDRDPKQIEWREKYGKTISEWGQRRENGVADAPRRGGNSGLATQANNPGRNIRSVWTIATRPYADAHFAVFPPELPERCIKAGSSERGVCPECGAPWERVVERGGPTLPNEHERRPTCRHETLKPSQAVILDPFAGSGTVGLVANRLSRKAILIDLNPDYLRQQMRRNAQTPLGLSS